MSNEAQDIDFAALKAKFENTDEFPRMYGTQGGLDYIILAKRPDVNLQLGIKPLISIGTDKTSVGFRLRSAPIPGTVVDMSVPLLPGADTAGQVIQGYPATGWSFPWEKSSDERASLVRMFTYDRGASEIAFLWQDMKAHRFYGKLTAFLMEKVEADHLQVTPEDLNGFFQAILCDPVFKVASKYDPALKAEHLKMQGQAALAEAEALEKWLAENPTKTMADYKPVAASAEFQSAESVAEQMLQGVKPDLQLIEGGLADAIMDAPVDPEDEGIDGLDDGDDGGNEIVFDTDDQD